MCFTYTYIHSSCDGVDLLYKGIYSVCGQGLINSSVTPNPRYRDVQLRHLTVDPVDIDPAHPEIYSTSPKTPKTLDAVD